MESVSTTCCIAGGGPAGMMLGLLLARAGVRTTVLEKHADFLRDFRGDTIHPSTLEVMHELDLLTPFLRLPHHKARHLSAQFGERKLRVADFSHLPVRCGFIAFMPQWDFLDFLADRAGRFPNFELRMDTEVDDLLCEHGQVCGVSAQTPEGRLEVRAPLVVAADGRGSTVRELSGLEVEALGAPMDVLWFHLPRGRDDPDEAMGRFAAGRMLIMINRTDYWQCGFVIAKGSLDAVRARGLPAFRQLIAELAPFAANRVGTIDDWDQVKLLTVAVDRLPVWHQPGLLVIGDAAHAMSPIGGVGVNLAIQDAVATANLLAEKLLEGRPDREDLAAVQRRREWPTRVTQRLQLIIQNRVIKSVLAGAGRLEPPLPLRAIAALPLLQRLPARLIGLGIRPEHVTSPDADATAT